MQNNLPAAFSGTTPYDLQFISNSNSVGKGVLAYRFISVHNCSTMNIRLLLNVVGVCVEPVNTYPRFTNIYLHKIMALISNQ